VNLDLDYLATGLVGPGSCYTGVDADELLALIRIARAAVAWRDAWSAGYASAADHLGYRMTQEALRNALQEAGV
jgi:hypothetical protein